MSGQIGQFITKVIETLYKNGYPDKRVSLPLDRMYERASEEGYSFNKVLDFLKEKEGIDHEKTNEKIIFFPKSVEEEPAASVPFGLDPQEISNMMQGFDLEKLKDAGPSSLMMQAAEVMKQLTPEQISKMRNMVEGLSEEERKELMRKARDLGFPGA